jgi:glycosyltransferase involved in cell wall biosynthesis
MDPLVSVIVPCHNYEKYIEQCILSILVQRANFNVEVVIGDDCSTDYSLSIAKRMKNWYESENFIFTIVEREREKCRRGGKYKGPSRKSTR